MYIMLLKIYYSSFSVFTASTFDWLIDGRSLVETKFNHLINSVCFRVRLITKTAYILVRNTEVTVWKCAVKSTVHGTWIWKIQYQFADTKIDWLRDGARPDSHVTALWAVHIATNNIYFLPYHFTNINLCH